MDSGNMATEPNSNIYPKYSKVNFGRIVCSKQFVTTDAITVLAACSQLHIFYVTPPCLRHQPTRQARLRQEALESQPLKKQASKMFFSSVLLSFICILALYFLLKKTLGFGKESSLPLPPGPYGIPILGYLPFLGKQPHHVLTKLGKKYGSVFSISMGKYQGVVLHDWKAIKAGLIDQGEIFAGRPVLDIVKDIGGRFGIIGTDGKTWKDQRRFSIGQLRDLGFGKTVMESAIHSEVDDLLVCLENKGKDGIDMKNILFVPLLNVIWSIVAGKRFNYDDYSLEYFKKLISEFIILSGVQDFLFLPNVFIQMGYRKSFRQKRREVVLELLAYMGKEIANHKESLSEEERQRDFMYSYLHEINRQHKLGEAENTTFSENQLKSISLNFFLAGVETTASTIGWLCLYVALWPEVQEKVNKELDAVLGNRSPVMSDRQLLPYTNAVILEVQRMASIVPFSIAHRNLKSTTLLGYHIPKDCVIIPNLWNLSHDPNIWGDPENFRPERFLNQEGTVVKPDYFLPFSAGPRICLGESLAKLELFIFVTNMLHQFTFKLPENSTAPDMTVKFGVTLPPPDVTLIVEKKLK